MRIAGITNFYVPTINNRLDLRNVKHADVQKPEPKQKYVDYYIGGFGTYSNKSKSENMENLLSILRNIETKEPKWQSFTLEIPTGETIQLKYSNTVDLRKGNAIDIQT